MRMNEFLGKHNGQAILTDIFTAMECTKEQARAAVTTYCCLFKINPDTAEWDNLMNWIFNCYNSWFRSFEDLDNYMSELLV